MVAYLIDRGLDGASVLEIEGGVGDIQLELLGQGASRTTNLELVDASSGRSRPQPALGRAIGIASGVST
jgi:hypothetical protein